jgi:hypothetical protein
MLMHLCPKARRSKVRGRSWTTGAAGNQDLLSLLLCFSSYSLGAVTFCLQASNPEVIVKDGLAVIGCCPQRWRNISGNHTMDNFEQLIQSYRDQLAEEEERLKTAEFFHGPTAEEEQREKLQRTSNHKFPGPYTGTDGRVQMIEYLDLIKRLAHRHHIKDPNRAEEFHNMLVTFLSLPSLSASSSLSACFPPSLLQVPSPESISVPRTRDQTASHGPVQEV